MEKRQRSRFPRPDKGRNRVDRAEDLPSPIAPGEPQEEAYYTNETGRAHQLKPVTGGQNGEKRPIGLAGPDRQVALRAGIKEVGVETGVCLISHKPKRQRRGGAGGEAGGYKVKER